MAQIPLLKGKHFFYIDLQFDIWKITRNHEPDITLPKLKSVKPQGEEIPANNKKTEPANQQFNKITADRSLIKALNGEISIKNIYCSHKNVNHNKLVFIYFLLY
jgi:hypothetical protein